MSNEYPLHSESVGYTGRGAKEYGDKDWPVIGIRTSDLAAPELRSGIVECGPRFVETPFGLLAVH